MQIALYPFQDQNNPFIRLLRAALEKQAVLVAETDQCNPIWLLRHRREIQALHFHWIQSLYSGRTYLGTLGGLLRFSINLLSARIMNYRIVWTVHNLFPHQSRYKGLDRLARKIIVFFASAIVVHCDHARQLAQKMLRTRKDITVIPHGHYADYYTTGLDQQAARSLFALPSEARIFLMIGRIAPYKGIVDLIGHFKGAHQDGLLVIAGQPSDSELADHILQQTHNQRRIITMLRRLDDEELAHLVIASDVVVFPFVNILTSGSVVAALSLGRPVIAPRMGCLEETVEEGMGLLYDPVDGGLKASLEAACGTSFDEPGSIISRVKSQMDWMRIGKAYRRIYNPGTSSGFAACQRG